MRAPGKTKTPRSASASHSSFGLCPVLWPFAPQIERALGPQHIIAGGRQRGGEPIAAAGKRLLIDRKRFEIRHRVLHHGAREAPAERHLGGEHGVAERGPLGGRHQRANREITQPLARREQNLAVAVGDQGPGVETRRAGESVPVETQAPVRLVGEEKDAPADPPRGALKQLGEPI
jgi:hypothetical protein